MNNLTTARAELRASETCTIILLQTLGLIARVGHGQFSSTEKLVRLTKARSNYAHGGTLSEEEKHLLEECHEVVLA